MNIEELREYCLLKKGVSESLPFGPEALVFKVMNKVFLIAPLNLTPLQFNLKSMPENAIRLREEYQSVRPGFHMNKKHWNTVIADGSVDDKLLKQWIDESYFLVVNKLTKKEIEIIKNLTS